MSPFLKNVEEIFAAAQHAEPEAAELAILVSREGAIHMLPAIGWELELLRRQHGAREAYRITRTVSQVRLEARSANECCVMQSQKPGPAFPPIAPDFPQYRMVCG